MPGDIVYVGSKPATNYCMAALLSLNKWGRVTLKARGYAITKAVDVTEMTRKKLMSDVVLEKVEIGNEERESTEGGTRHISTITIVLRRGETHG